MKKKVIYSGMIAALLITGSITKTNAQSWSLNGNAGTTATNYLGTSDAQDLRIKTNNVTRMFVKGSNGFIGIGTSTPGFILDIQNSGNSSMNFKSATGNANILIDRGTSATTAAVNYRTAGVASWQTGNLANNNFVINNVGTNPPSLTVLKTNNYMGINNSAPTSQLDVLGGSGTGDTNAVVSGVTGYTGSLDVVGVQGTSVSSPGFGIGVAGVGNFIGVIGVGFVGVDGESAGPDTSAANTGDLTGVQGFTSLGATSVGVFGNSSGASYNFGVYGQETDTVQAGGQHHDYAVVCVGDLFYWRAFAPSDRKLKSNIEPYTGALDKLQMLNTSSYTFNHAKYPGMALPSGKQIGFLSDDVERAFPELVGKGSIPAGGVKDARGRIHYNNINDVKAVNYIGLIPVLAEAIKEQKAIVDAKDAQISDLNTRLIVLESRLNALETAQAGEKISSSTSGARLEQNSPNPFSSSTVIRYSIPANSSAQIVITGSNGSTLKNYLVKSSGQITISANELSVGSYTYSLLVDGKVVDTKTLVLTK